MLDEKLMLCLLTSMFFFCHIQLLDMLSLSLLSWFFLLAEECSCVMAEVPHHVLTTKVGSLDKAGQISTYQRMLDNVAVDDRNPA